MEKMLNLLKEFDLSIKEKDGIIALLLDSILNDGELTNILKSEEDIRDWLSSICVAHELLNLEWVFMTIEELENIFIKHNQKEKFSKVRLPFILGSELFEWEEEFVEDALKLGFVDYNDFVSKVRLVRARDSAKYILNSEFFKEDEKVFHTLLNIIDDKLNKK